MSKSRALLIAVASVAILSIVILIVRHYSRPPLSLSGPLIRETRTVGVNGVTEMWQLQWRSTPKPWCDILNGPWETAPCQGFTYGEAGELDLVRYRNSREYERLHLTPFFSAFPEHGAIVQRWPAQRDDLTNGVPLLNSPEMQALLSRVRARPTVKILSLTDDDHDGNATEFFLQTEAEAGHRYGVVVGVSANNPHLHAFGTALHPDMPLVLKDMQWFELHRRGDMNVPVRVSDWKCPDRGATTDTELELEPTAKGISVIRREYACGKEPRQLIREEYK